MSTFVNPFESDVESHPNEPSTSIKAKKNKKPNIKVAKGKSKKVAVASTPPVKELFGSESDSETDTTPKGPKKIKRIRAAYSSEEEGDLEPVRAAALRSSLSRRTASGNSYQQDLTRSGDYYIELRVYNHRDAEKFGKDRWKQALLTYRASVYSDSATWRATNNLVSAAKAEFKGVQPVLYPNNII